ncbi:MAG: histidine kinase [Actinobacteria bacterium HGW-Actinobacteria-5]|jgi:CBS domain-containing protein|nr:MAG: histidine kinase [Actinobacteria bacterium HGW-Actinobacteria-5]
MKIEDIIRNKGADVVTIAPAATVAELVELLGRNNIGAVVVSEDGATISGIVSERDVVRHLADGTGVLSQPVSAIMTANVKTCTPEDSLEATGHTMTYSRIRHLPVVGEDGKLAAIVSIGDVVKYRIDQLTDERNHLLEYLHT